jgi:hypothetical protein
MSLVRRVMRMNLVTFEIYVDVLSSHVVRICVDGLDLAYLAGVVEAGLAGAENLSGDYGGLTLDEMAGPSRRLWGEDAGYGKEGTKSALLGCGGCGIEGCWPLIADILVSEQTVTWSNFEQPHCPHWNLSALGPFIFDRTQYAASISALNTLRHV